MRNDFEIINDNEFKTIVGYNPFLNMRSGNGRKGSKAIESYCYYFDMLMLLSQIAYRWKNIPTEIPNYQMERCLFFTGIAGLYKDKTLDKYVILPCVKHSGGLDIYGEAEQYKVYSYSNTYNKIFTNNKDGVICFNNNIKKPNMYLAYRYSKRLQLIDEIIDLNISQQKSPYIIICNEKTKNTLKQIITKISLGEEAIYGTKELDIENVIKTLDLQVELKAKDLIEAKKEIFNEACMYLGITTNISEKKERLIASEVSSSERRFDVYREIGLAPRKYFCEKVKKVFPDLNNIDVEYVLDDKELEDIKNQIMLTNKTNRVEMQNKAYKKKEDK